MDRPWRQELNAFMAAFAARTQEPMDGGRMQRRDLFAPWGTRQSLASGTPPAAPCSESATPARATHWREDKVGAVLAMESAAGWPRDNRVRPSARGSG